MTTPRIPERPSISMGCMVALVASLWLCPGGAAAGPDIDGAVDALISTPLDTTGSVVGSAGLIMGALGGTVGDLVSFIDDNQYSRIVLRGLVSKTIQRISLGISQLSTGALEGFRAEDLKNYPESASAYTENRNPTERLDTLGAGVGGTYVAVTDAVGGPLVMLLRGVGLTDQAGSIANWQSTVRERYFGPLVE